MVCGGRTRSVYNPPHTSGVSGRAIENEEGIGNSNLAGRATAADPPDLAKSDHDARLFILQTA